MWYHDMVYVTYDVITILRMVGCWCWYHTMYTWYMMLYTIPSVWLVGVVGMICAMVPYRVHIVYTPSFGGLVIGGVVVWWSLPMVYSVYTYIYIKAPREYLAT